MKFGISSLMLLVFVASIICGIVLNGSFLAFAIGFMALAVLLGRLVSRTGPGSLTVQETATDAEAHLLRNYLTDHGVTAWVEGGLAIQAATGGFRPRVVVPERQAELASKVLHEFESQLRNQVVSAPGNETVEQEFDLADRPVGLAAVSVGPFPSTAPVVEEIAWPENIPLLLRRFAGAPYALFLDSARRDSQLGRYSYLTADPFEVIRSRGGRVLVSQPGREHRVIRETDPLAVLAARLARWPAERLAELPPFQGGAAGLFSYDLCHHIEKLPRPGLDEFELPDLAVGLFDWVVALDHEQRRSWIVSTGIPAEGSAQRHDFAQDRVAQVREWLADRSAAGMTTPDATAVRLGATSIRNASARLSPESLARQFPIGHAAGSPSLTSNFSRDQYLKIVERAIEYIHAGDVYQVNLAQRLLAPLAELPIELYLRLRERNPAPFAGFFDLGDFVIASASPERFLRVQNGEVETRPIKGTRPRWPVPEADMYSGSELRESDKDRAENVMIVDLLRNDIGRVCEFGSVRVTDPLRLESYQFVHHLVSEVRGRLRPNFGPIDLLRAAFPGGSVTGAPKIRAMEIIAELEPTARGAYCGSLGYIGFDGSMDTSILIRTFTCGRGWIQFPVGGGIVAQSSPEREYEETLHKAEGMIRALER